MSERKKKDDRVLGAIRRIADLVAQRDAYLEELDAAAAAFDLLLPEGPFREYDHILAKDGQRKIHRSVSKRIQKYKDLRAVREAAKEPKKTNSDRLLDVVLAISNRHQQDLDLREILREVADDIRTEEP